MVFFIKMTEIKMENISQLKEFLEGEGYYQLRKIEGRGLCGLLPFIYTVAIVYGIDSIGYKGRYCYPRENANDLVLAYTIWDGKEDPIGNWIKHKGYTEYTNPNYKNKY